MKRLVIICEGPTEQAFCSKILQPYFFEKGISIESPLIKKSGGGIVGWKGCKNDIEKQLRTGAYVSTLFDYYGIEAKHQFPDWENCEKIPNKYTRMDALEKAMYEDLEDSIRYRYIPYLQLHEFEGLLFNDIQIFYNNIPPDD